MCDGGVVAADEDDHWSYDVAENARVSLRTCLEPDLPLLLKFLQSPPAMDTPKKQFAS